MWRDRIAALLHRFAAWLAHAEALTLTTLQDPTVMSTWLHVLDSIAPLILASNPATAPFAPLILIGIKAVEAIPGASGAQKRAIVQTLVQVGATGINTATGRTATDPDLLASTAGTVVDAVIATTNAVHATIASAPVAPTPAPTV